MVNALDVDIKKPLPLIFRHHAQKAGPANAGVADQNVHIADGCEGGTDGFALGNVAADSLGAGFFGYGLGGGVFFFIEKVYGIAPGGKKLHRSGADAPGSAGDQHG